MSQQEVYIVAAEGEDELVEQLASPLREAGYDVVHNGTVAVGESLVTEAMRAIEAEWPIVLCGTRLAVGSSWAHQIVKACHASGARRLFVAKMDKLAYVDQLALKTQVAHYCDDPAKAKSDLLAALMASFPPLRSTPAGANVGRQPSREYLDEPTTVAEVELGGIREFRRQLREEVAVRYPHTLSDHEFLERVGLWISNGLTRAGVILFAKNPSLATPQAMAKCTQYFGADQAANREPLTYEGPLLAQIVSARDFVASRVGHVDSPTADTMQSTTAYNYPMIAVREVISNAMVHRDYSISNACVHIRLFVDRLEVTSPGVWVGRELTNGFERDLSELAGQSIKRNFRLAHLLSWVRLVEGDGSGIPTALRDCRRTHSPSPTVVQDQGFVTVTIFPRSPATSTPKPPVESVKAAAAVSESDLLRTLLATATRTDSQTQLDNAASSLAEAVRFQWERESELRGLFQVTLLPVSWVMTYRSTRVPEIKRMSSMHFSAGYADALRHTPDRRLVVLGPPGSGKTVFALQLTIALLEDRQPGDPVPVLMSAATWDAQHEHLDTWLVRRISEDYPILGDRAEYGSNVVDRLVGSDRVLPVLDGFDEIPAPLRQATALSLTSTNRPLVITSRRSEYEATIREVAPVIAPSVIELEPLQADTVVHWIAEGISVDNVARWRPVIDSIREHPNGMIAKTLASPLMLSLARTAYRAPDTSPAELIDETRFPTPTQLEEHLLGTFVGNVYSEMPAAPGDRFSSPDTHIAWNHSKAQHWLAFIASHLNERGTASLAWWELHQAVPARAARLVFVAFVGIVGWIVGTATIGIAVGRGAGVAAGAIIGVTCAFTAAVPSVVGSLPGRPVRLSVRVRRGVSTRESIGSVLAGGLSPGLVMGVVAALAFNGVVGVIVGLVAGIAGGVVLRLIQWSRPADHATAISPNSVLYADRFAAMVHALGVAVVLTTTIGFTFGQAKGTTAGLFVGAVGGLSLSFGFVLGTAWAWYQAVRCWLAFRGKVPLRLMRFLKDAHRRGILRQTGSVYQFRHITLQNYLARPENTEHAGRQTPSRGGGPR